MIYNIEEELEKYELAKTNFSNVPADKWESTEVVTDENGRTYTAGVKDGMLFELQPNEEETTNTETQEAAVIPNVVEDIAKGSVRGMSKAGRNTTSFGSNVLGAPGDVANWIGQNITSNENFDMFLGGEDINNRIQQGLTWVGDNIMGNNAVDQWAAEDFNNETLGQVSELIAQFATPAIPAAKVTKAADLLITGMQSLNPFKRGLIWGAIADAAAFDENVDTLTGELAKYVAGQTPEERTAFGNAIVDVFEKNPEHAELVNQLKGSLEGLVLGSGIEVFMRAAVMGSKLINWKELFNRIEFDPNTVSFGGIGGISLKKKPTDTEPGIIAFHGSGADFDEFKLEKIGTGEGNQAFGHGLYFTDSKDIAKFYKKQLEADKYKTSDGKIFDPYKMRDDGYRVIRNLNVRAALHKNKGDVNKAIERAEEIINNSTLGNKEILQMAKEDLSLLKDIKARGGLKKANEGKIYQVNIKTVMDNLIDYDKPFGQQNENIKKILDKMKSEVTIEDAINYGLDPNDPGSNLFMYVNKNSSKETIEKEAIKQTQNILFSKDQEVIRFLNDWAVLRGKQSSAETLLAKYGAKGIKYKANQGVGARNVPETGQNNYVIFDDKIIDIMAKMGIVGLIAISAIKNNKEQTQDNSI